MLEADRHGIVALAVSVPAWRIGGESTTFRVIIEGTKVTSTCGRAAHFVAHHSPRGAGTVELVFVTFSASAGIGGPASSPQAFFAS